MPKMPINYPNVFFPVSISARCCTRDRNLRQRRSVAPECLTLLLRSWLENKIQFLSAARSARSRSVTGYNEASVCVCVCVFTEHPVCIRRCPMAARGVESVA